MSDSPAPKRLAHEIVVAPPEAGWGDAVSLRHLTRYHLARAHALLAGWYDTLGRPALDDPDPTMRRLDMERLGHAIMTARVALLYVALCDGLTGQDAAVWVESRSGADSIGEWVWESCLRFDIDPDGIEPYRLLPEATP